MRTSEIISNGIKFHVLELKDATPEDIIEFNTRYMPGKYINKVRLKLFIDTKDYYYIREGEDIPRGYKGSDLQGHIDHLFAVGLIMNFENN